MNPEKFPTGEPEKKEKPLDETTEEQNLEKTTNREEIYQAQENIRKEEGGQDNETQETNQLEELSEGEGVALAEEEIKFEAGKEEMPWDTEALMRSNREFLEEYGLVPELKEETLRNIDNYLQDDIFRVQLKMAEEWVKIGDNEEKIRNALGGKDQVSPRELVAEVKRMGGFEQMMKEEQLSERIDELKDRWKQLNTLRDTWRKGESPAQAAGLTLYVFENKRKGLEAEIKTKKEEVVEHWKKLTTGKFAPGVKESIRREYQQLLEELKEKEQKLQTLQQTQRDILEATAGLDLEREARREIMADLIKTGKKLETESGIRRFAQEMGWKVEGLSMKEKITRKLKGEPTDVIRVTYDTGEVEEVPESDLKEVIIQGYKENREREEMTKLIEKAAPSKTEAVKNAYEALKGALIKRAKEKELNKVASPEEIEKLKEIVGEGEVDVINGIENLNRGILDGSFSGNIEGDYSTLKDMVGSSGLGEMPGLEEIQGNKKLAEDYRKVMESKDRVGLMRWIIEVLLEGIKPNE